MRDALRITRVQLAVLRRSYAVMATHVLGLTALTLLAAARIREQTATAEAILPLLLFAAAAGAPLSVGAHVLVSERFRGTLEALLLLPITKRALLGGKALVILLIAMIEVAGLIAFFAVLASLTGDAELLAVLTSSNLLVMLCAAAPLTALLLTLIVITISGRVRDAQAASNAALLVAGPIAAVVLAVWFGALTLGGASVFALVAVLVLLCAVAARAATAWLTDDRLLARRG